VSSRPLRPLRKDHLERMRPARRLRHVQGRPTAAMHLQPNGRAACAAVSVEPLKHLRQVRKLLRRNRRSAH
jgi:hypothetical protein